MTTVSSSPRVLANTSGKVAGALLLVVVGFQMALAAGAPWGAAAFGGQQTGVLPDELRVTSAVVAVSYLFLAVAAASRLIATRVRRPLMYGAAALMAVGFILNVASPSLIERLLWAPVTIALVLAFWQAARSSRSTACADSRLIA